MFRKTAIALTATAALAAAALAPTSASAWHYHPHGHWGGWYHGRGWVGPAIVAGALVTGAAIAAANSCYQPQVVGTPYGPRRVWVNVC